MGPLLEIRIASLSPTMLSDSPEYKERLKKAVRATRAGLHGPAQGVARGCMETQHVQVPPRFRQVGSDIGALACPWPLASARCEDTS